MKKKLAQILDWLNYINFLIKRYSQIKKNKKNDQDNYPMW